MMSELGVNTMIEKTTAQLNIVVDKNIKFRLEDIILKKRRAGENITQNELLTKYIIKGLEKDEKELG